MTKKYKITDRKGLKEFFKKGKLPDETAFGSLIDSTFNIADDKLDITEEGLMIYPSENGEEKLLNFFGDRDDFKPTWAMYASKKPTVGLSIKTIKEKDSGNPEENNKTEQPAFFIQKDGGNIGMGTNTPRQQLDVVGVIASQGRMGTLIERTVAADGNWYNIFDDETGLSGSNAFEIIAYAEGRENEQRYSLMHAIAVGTPGNSKSKISKTVAHSDKWWNKIDLRWQSRLTNLETKKFVVDRSSWFGLSIFWNFITGKITPKSREKYNLQIRTRSNYGKKAILHFNVSVLWKPDFRMPGTAENSAVPETND